MRKRCILARVSTASGPATGPSQGQAPVSAAALVIGNELLTGKVHEGNLVKLAQLLRGRGIELRRAVFVTDDVDIIASEVQALSKAHDWLFTSGGVGPTHDDVTIEAVAKAFGVPVQESDVLAAMIRSHYGDRCTEGHLRMALMPSGAALEVTPEVRWPTLRMGNVWLLPGIPEIFQLKLQVVAAHLGTLDAFLSRAVFTNMDEGDLKPLLDAVVRDFPDVSVGSYPKWHDPSYKTKLTFDTRDPARLAAATDAFLALLPPGEPQKVE